MKKKKRLLKSIALCLIMVLTLSMYSSLPAFASESEEPLTVENSEWAPELESGKLWFDDYIYDAHTAFTYYTAVKYGLFV